MVPDQRSAPPRWSRQLARYFSTEVVNSIATVLGVAVFTRLVSPADYGAYALTIAASGIVMAVVGEWLQASVLRLVPGREARSQLAAVVAAQRLSYAASGIVLAGTVIGFVVAPTIQLRLLVAGAGLLAALNVLFLTWTVLFQASLNAGAFARYRSAYAIMRIVFAVLLVWGFGRSPVALVGGGVVSLLVLVPAAWRTLRPRLAAAVGPGEIATARASYLAFGLPLIGWYAASQTLNLSDRFFVEASRGTAEVGLYSVTYSLAMGVISGIVQPLLSTMHPLIVQGWHDHGSETARHRLRAALRTLVLLAPLLIASLGFFGPALLRVLAPARYETRGALAALLGTGVLLWFASLFLQKELELRLQSRRLLINLVTAACVNLGANSLLIPAFGLMGAACATTLGYATYAVLTLAAGRSGIPVVPAKTYVVASVATGLFSAVVILLSRFGTLQHALPRVLIVGPAAALVYVGFVVGLGELRGVQADLQFGASGL